MDIHSKIIVCTPLNGDGKVVKKDRFENSFDRLQEYLSGFHEGDSFVMESTGFYEPLYDFIESHGFHVKLANTLKIRLIAESRMKNDDLDSEVLAKLQKNGCPVRDVPSKDIREMRRMNPQGPLAYRTLSSRLSGNMWKDTGWPQTRKHYSGKVEEEHTEYPRTKIKKIDRSARVPMPHSHAFRHRVATTLLYAGMDLVQVQSQLGHISPLSTKAYDHSARVALGR